MTTSAVAGRNPAPQSASPTRSRRLLIAIGIGLFAAGASWFATHRASFGAPPDFHWTWVAAKAMLKGENPYSTGSYYPLPAFITAVPFTYFASDVATALFSGITSAILAWVVTRTSYERLPIFLSASFAHGAVQGQSSMLLAAAVFAPSLSAVGAIKPNIGLAILAYRPTWRAALAMLAFAAVGLLIMPDWPKHWLATFGGTPTAGTAIHSSPLKSPGGIIALLALLRWRRPEARLLATMAVVPQSPFVYEVLPLFAVAKTRFQCYALVIGTDLALAYYALAPKKDMVAFFHNNGIAVFVCVYLPALILVLKGPNDGALPAFLERLAGMLPRWIRGRAAVAA
jgi:hypothetical protein